MGAGSTGAYMDVSPAKPGRQVDPEMEEILESIRRIISDDQKALSVQTEPAQTAPRQRDSRRQSSQAPRLVAAKPQATAQAAPRKETLQSEATRVSRPAPGRAEQRAGLDDDLHRMTANASRAPDVDSVLPPRPASRPSVRLAEAPPVDYRPPAARQRPSEEMDIAGLVDRRLADIIRRAVVSHVNVNDEVDGSGPGLGSDEYADSGSVGVDFDQFAEEPEALAPMTRTPGVGQDYGPASQEQDAAARAPHYSARTGEATANTGAPISSSVSRRFAPLPGETFAQPETEAPSSGISPAAAPASPLVSPQASARISGAFNALTQQVAAERARTMEETVTDMLRPMLASWLEAHLPAIVERLVGEQVQRLSRGPAE